MSAGPFVIEFIIVFLATLAILHQYGNLRKQHALVTLAVFISWFFSFLIIFILPLDVSSTCYKDCLNKHPQQGSDYPKSYNNTTTTETTTSAAHRSNCVQPYSFMPENVLPGMWRVVYWSSQILSWLLLPMMQSYVYAGAFSVWGKLKTAIYENLLWYGSYLIIFGALLVYVAVKPELSIDAESLKLIGVTASNTWGLLLLVLLLGYGLVELPRSAWTMSLPGLRLDQTYFRVAKLSTEKEDAEEELADVLAEVKRSSEEIRYNSNMRKYVDTIIDKCPEGSVNLFSKGTEDFIDYEANTTNMPTEKILINLHKKVIVVTHRAHRAQVQWNKTLKLAFYLEDIERNKSNGEKIFKSSFSDHHTVSHTKLKLTWLWEITLKPWLFKFLALVLLILSVALVWSEMTFFSTDPKLSIFALLLDVTKKDYLYFHIEMVSCLTIAYMCACTYYTIFKIKFFHFYYFAPHHQTDSNSLLFSGLLLCRLTYALCLNFLALIHLDGHVTGRHDEDGNVQTDFTKLMGHLDLLSFVAKGFNVYYPMIVLLVCFCTYFSLGKRILHCIGIQQFLSDDDFSADYVREGREITKREKRALEREINGKSWSERSKNIQEKYSRFTRRSSKQSRENQHRIDDDSDDGMINPLPQPNTANINGSIDNSSSARTKLTMDSRSKYTKFNNDSDMDGISGIDYAPPSSSGRNIHGYEGIGGTSRTKPPRNIFDDA